MKKFLLVLLCSVAALAAISCESSDQEQTAAQQAAQTSVKGADGIARPEWVLTGREDDTGIYAVGSGKLSNDQRSLTLARTNARAELARTLSAATQSVLRSYTQDVGNPKDLLTYFEEATQIKAASLLKGSTQKDFWKAEDGTFYVLMYVPYKAILPEVTELAGKAKDFVQDSKTVLTEVKAQEAFEKYFSEN